MSNAPAPRPRSPGQAEATLRLLRTVLAEARGVIETGGVEERLLVLGQRIARAQKEAEALAPDFSALSVRNGPSGG